MQVDMLARLENVIVAGDQVVGAHDNGHNRDGSVQFQVKPCFFAFFHRSSFFHSFKEGGAAAPPGSLLNRPVSGPGSAFINGKPVLP